MFFDNTQYQYIFMDNIYLYFFPFLFLREITDNLYITEIPANAFQGITNDVLMV